MSPKLKPRRKGKIPATRKTMEALRLLGFQVDVCERFIQGGRVRKDLFGLFDLIAFDDRHTIGVQCFTTGWSEHMKKLELPDNNQMIRMWLAGNRSFEMWGWSRRKLCPGKPAIRLFPRIVNVHVELDKLAFTELMLD